MPKKAMWLAAVVMLLITSLAVNTPARADGEPVADNSFDVKVELTGVILALAPDGIVLVDGTLVKLTPATFIGVALQANQQVKIVADMQGNDIVALSILGPDVDVPTVILETPTPTPTPTT